MRIRPATRRADLLLAAARLFRERGYDGVSVAEIAEQVGITAAAVYRHFPGKRDLLVEPIREMVLTWRDREVLALAEPGAPTETMARLVASVVDVVMETPDVVGLWHQETHHLPAEVREELVAVRAECVGWWRDVLLAARAELDSRQAEFRIRAALGLLNCVPEVPRRRSLPHRRALEELMLAALLAPAPPRQLTPTRNLGRAASGRHRHGKRGQEILAGAAQLFRHRGYHSVGVDEIGTAIGIAGPSIYNHFSSKAALLTAVVEEITDELCWGGALALGTRKDPREVLELLVTTHVEIALAKRDLIAVWMTEAHRVPGELADKVHDDRRRYLGYWLRALAAVRPDLPEPVARTVCSSVMELIHAIARSSRFVDVPELPQWTVGLALAALTVEQPAQLAE